MPPDRNGTDQTAKNKVACHCISHGCSGRILAARTAQKHRKKDRELCSSNVPSFSTFKETGTLTRRGTNPQQNSEETNVLLDEPEAPIERNVNLPIPESADPAGPVPVVVARDEQSGDNIDSQAAQELAWECDTPLFEDISSLQASAHADDHSPVSVNAGVPSGSTSNPEQDPDQEPNPDRDDPGSSNDLASAEQRELNEAAQAEQFHQQAASFAALNQQINAAPGDSGGGDPEDDEEIEEPPSSIEEVRLVQQLIQEIREATLEKSGLDKETIYRLRNPLEFLPDISDPDTRLSLDLFMATTNASEATYNAAREAILRRFPHCEILSFHLVKKLLSEITGIVAIEDDMCINSCHAFVGPLADLDRCIICSEPRYDPVELALTGKKVARQIATTFPIGPQLQARKRSPESATAAKYCYRKAVEVLTSYETLDEDNMVYDDVFSGTEFMDLAAKAGLTENDSVISFSVDGAQLYQNKKSDAWIGAALDLSLPPQDRYKKNSIFPTLIIPGPNKPKLLNTFFFRGVQHMSALQRENDGRGFRVWDASTQSVSYSRLLLAIANADTVGLIELDGRVGHHGAHGCRLGCEMLGRHKPGSGHYYAAHLLPNCYSVLTCNHGDVDPRQLTTLTVEKYNAQLAIVTGSSDQTAYEKNRKETGISKPSLLLGLVPRLIFPVPRCFTTDLMHLLTNVAELMIALWRGTIKRGTQDNQPWEWRKLTGDIWITHGKQVAAATPHFPTSFHRPPRNPAEKISSGYKATEYFLYVFGLCPALLRSILPLKYWQSFCKLVRAIRIISQRSITGRQVQEAQTYIIQFIEEFEVLYYQRRVDRLHFCRPCIHSLSHIPSEILRVGPGAYSTQFTLERTIGDFGRDIRQPSNPFANLAQRALLRSQINGVLSMFPDLNQSARKKPIDITGARDLGGNFIMLGPKDDYPTQLSGRQQQATQVLGAIKVRRYGRLALPNGQIARSLYREQNLKKTGVRISRNVKFSVDDAGVETAVGEVRFYFLTKSEGTEDLLPWALISVYSSPHKGLYEESFGTVQACRYLGDRSLRVIPAKSILSVVSMQPLPPETFEPPVDNYWFVVEKSSMDSVDAFIEPLEDVNTI